VDIDGVLCKDGTVSSTLATNNYVTTTSQIKGPNGTGLSVGTHYDGNGAGVDIVSTGYNTTMGDFNFISANGSYNSFGQRMKIKGDGSIVVGTDPGGSELVRVGGGAIYSGFSKLGAGAPGIKIKKLTGTTAAAQGGYVTIAHGLTGGKIISATVLVSHETNSAFPPSNNAAGGYQYSWYFGATNFYVTLSATDSGNITSKPIVITIIYEE
jgi:hypothetical protein